MDPIVEFYSINSRFKSESLMETLFKNKNLDENIIPNTNKNKLENVINAFYK